MGERRRGKERGGRGGRKGVRWTISSFGHTCSFHDTAQEERTKVEADFPLVLVAAQHLVREAACLDHRVCFCTLTSKATQL